MHATPAAKISNLRVCSSTAFSKRLGRCTKDERSTPIVSNRITCSVALTVARTSKLRQWMRYEGQLVPYPSNSVQPGRWTFWINQDYKINLPVPGGAFECGFAIAGKKITAAFTSGGPKGDVVNTAACTDENTIPYGDGRVCRSDQSASPLPATDRLQCYAMYPMATGKVARIAVVSGTDVLDEISFTPDSPLWYGWISVDSPSGGTFAAGRYACQYFLDGVLVAEKPFDVLGS